MIGKFSDNVVVLMKHVRTPREERLVKNSSAQKFDFVDLEEQKVTLGTYDVN